MTTSVSDRPSAVSKFEFPTAAAVHAIRTVSINGEPWFIAADVCVALGLGASKGGYSHHLPRSQPTSAAS